MEVAAFEAKTHLPKLLERIQKGECFVIAKHGHTVAELVAYGMGDPDKVRRAINKFQGVSGSP